MVASKNQLITGSQIRAARALLNWSARHLSRQCGVSHSAIARAEMPPHEGLRTDDREDLQDRRKPAIQLDKEAIVIRQPNPTMNFTPQNDQPMSELLNAFCGRFSPI
jgi:hypothetical protein